MYRYLNKEIIVKRYEQRSGQEFEKLYGSTGLVTLQKTSKICRDSSGLLYGASSSNKLYVMLCNMHCIIYIF